MKILVTGASGYVGNNLAHALAGMGNEVHALVRSDSAKELLQHRNIKIFKGKIDKIGQVLDPDNKVLKVRIRLLNSGNLLKPEMFTTVKVLNTEGSSAVSIPNAAILMDGGKNFVVEYTDKCHYEIREITVLKVVENKAYLSSGLKDGEKVITKNQLLLYSELRE